MDFKRIVFIAGTLAQGGAEKQLYYLVKALHEQGKEVSVISFTSGEYWEHEISKLGVRIYHCLPRVKAKRFWDIYAIIKKLRPEIVYAMHFYCNFYAAFSGRMAGVKLVLGSIRGNGYHDVTNVNRITAALSYYTPHAIVANSKHGAENARRIFKMGKKLRVLLNAIDQEYFHPAQEVQDKPEVCFVTVARLIPLKRIDIFLKMIKLLNEQGFAVSGVIVGYGEEELSLKEKAAKLKLDEVVHFTGKQDDVRKWLHRSDVLVSTSRSEGTPNVVIEAMACQLPVLAMRIEGIDNMVKHGVDGWLANTESELLEFAKILVMYDTQRKEMGKNGRTKVENNYALSGLYSNFVQMINTI